MERNMGSLDRVLRLILGLILIIAPLLNLPTTWTVAWLAYLSMGVGFVFTITAIFGVCPLYNLVGIKTT